MSDNFEQADSNVDNPAEAVGQAEPRKRAAVSNFLPIVSGRLPLVFVHAIRFDDVLLGMSTKDVASAFATSVGKVFDIRKGRNFGYITSDYTFSEEDFGQATIWADNARGGQSNRHGLTPVTGNADLLEGIIAQYRETRAGSAEALAEQAALKPKRPGRKAAPKAETEAAVTDTAEDLLA